MEQMKEYGVTDKAVLAAFEDVPRTLFVNHHDFIEAEEDYPLAIDEGQTISQPTLVAIMLQELALEPHHNVLEIGTGSGWQAALLSKLCNHVFTVERIDILYRRATKLLSDLGFTNVTTFLADGANGWPGRGGIHFDRIIVAAAADHIPDRLLYQLSDDGGRLLMPLTYQSESDAATHQHLVMCTKTGSEISCQSILPVQFVPLLDGVRKHH